MTNKNAELVAKSDIAFDRNGSDVHVVPVGQDHADAQCWCTPRVEYTAPNGGRIWLHRRANDSPYREEAGE